MKTKDISATPGRNGHHGNRSILLLLVVVAALISSIGIILLLSNYQDESQADVSELNITMVSSSTNFTVGTPTNISVNLFPDPGANATSSITPRVSGFHIILSSSDVDLLEITDVTVQNASQYTEVIKETSNSGTTQNYELAYVVVDGNDSNLPTSVVLNVQLMPKASGSAAISVDQVAAEVSGNIDEYVYALNFANGGTEQFTLGLTGDGGDGGDGGIGDSGTCDVDSLPFSDHIGHTFEEWITNLACDGIVKGYSDGTFKPDRNVKRGEMAKFVRLGLGFEPNTNCTEFPDINSSHVFYTDIITLKCEGVVDGFATGPNAGSFMSELDVTRGQATKFIVNGAREKSEDPNFMPNTQSSAIFPDVPVGHTFYDYVYSAYSAEVVNGFPDGYFRPDDPTTRGAMSKMVDLTRKLL
jgi:hypothetical protein